MIDLLYCTVLAAVTLGLGWLWEPRRPGSGDSRPSDPS